MVLFKVPVMSVGYWAAIGFGADSLAKHRGRAAKKIGWRRMIEGYFKLWENGVYYVRASGLTPRSVSLGPGTRSGPLH